MWQASEGLIAVLGAVFALALLRAVSGRAHPQSREPEGIAAQGNSGIGNEAAFGQAIHGSLYKAPTENKRPTVEDMAAKGL